MMLRVLGENNSGEEHLAGASLLSAGVYEFFGISLGHCGPEDRL